MRFDAAFFTPNFPTVSLGASSVLRNSLLTIHVLSVIVWLGCGLYELFLARELKKARGSPGEVRLARIYLKYAAPVPVATLLVAGTGAWMAVALHFGFFQVLWLGIKQGLMVVVLVIFASILPPFLKFQAAMNALPENASELPREVAARFQAIEPWLLVMRVLGAIAVVLAIWRPS
jgi:hypothetical protein